MRGRRRRSISGSPASRARSPDSRMPHPSPSTRSCTNRTIGSITITSLRAPNEVIAAIHGYGGIVLHDVISVRHAEKALEAGVDGLILVCAGAGGHAGTLSPFALIGEVR